MTQHQTLTISERAARNLLAAWNSGDLERLNSALDRSGSYSGRMSSAEREGIEMVQEIARTIQIWLRGVRFRSHADLTVSLKLLRHLAGCAVPAGADVPEEPSSIECPQPGTLACVPH